MAGDDSQQSVTIIPVTSQYDHHNLSISIICMGSSDCSSNWFPIICWEYKGIWILNDTNSSERLTPFGNSSLFIQTNWAMKCSQTKDPCLVDNSSSSWPPQIFSLFQRFLKKYKTKHTVHETRQWMTQVACDIIWVSIICQRPSLSMQRSSRSRKWDLELKTKTLTLEILRARSSGSKRVSSSTRCISSLDSAHESWKRMHNPYTAGCCAWRMGMGVGMYKDTLLICGGKNLSGPSVASALLANELEAGDAVFLGFVKLVPDRLMVALDEHRQGHRQLLPAWCACVERKCQNATLHRDARQQVDCPSVPQVGWIIWHLRFLWRI